MQLLEEQEYILQMASAHKNLQILALAGSGKTTVSLYVAQHLRRVHGKKTLILTYNKKLQVDTEERASDMGMKGYCKVKTINSATGRYCDPPRVCPKEEHLEAVLRDNCRMQPIDVDTVIIDEAQDLSPLLYSCIMLILNSIVQTNGRVQIIILGDSLQKLYGYRGAVADYLLDPSTHFFNYPFHLCRLTVNFRCSYEIVSYVNNLMADMFHGLQTSKRYRGWWAAHGHIMMSWWGNGLQPSPKAVEEKDMYHAPREVLMHKKEPTKSQSLEEWFQEVQTFTKDLEDQQYSPNDFPFIVPTPNCSASRIILQKLGKDKNFYFPDGEIDPDLAANKHQMITVHKMKGGSARCPIVLTPDCNWEKRCLRDQEQKKEQDVVMNDMKEDCEEKEDDDDFNPTDLVNLIYVAVTRAKEEMMVVYTGISFLKGDYEPLKRVQTIFSVHELSKESGRLYEALALDNICVQESITFCDKKLYFYDKYTRMFPGRTTKYGPTREDYAPVIGYAIEFAIANHFQQFLCNLKNVFEAVDLLTGWGVERGSILKLKYFLWEAEHHQVTWDDFLQLGIYKYCTHGVKYRQLFRQLTGTSCIDRTYLDTCSQRGVEMIQTLVGASEVVYHQCLSTEFPFVHLTGSPVVTVNGETDFLVGPTQVVVECKVTKDITNEHIMQALLYSALTPFFGQPCYVIAPNLNKCLRITPLPGITATYLLEHAIRKKLGCSTL